MSSRNLLMIIKVLCLKLIIQMSMQQNNYIFLMIIQKLQLQDKKRQVIVSPLQENKRTYMQILSPYIKATGSYAANASYNVYQWLKNGLVWAYDKMKNNVVPYTVNELPKYIFIVSNKKQSINQQSSQIIVVGIDDEEYEQVKNQVQKKKVTVIIPLGQKDQQFNEFLKKEGFVENSEMFSFDQSSEYVNQGIMIPYQSFETTYIQLKKQGKDMRQEEKVIHKLGDAIAITMSKQYDILQYPMLDILEQHEHSQTGFIVVPEKNIEKQSQILKEYQSEIKASEVQILENNQKQQIKQQTNDKQIQTIEKVQTESPSNFITNQLIVNKKVDNQRKVRVQLPKQSDQNIQKRQIQYA